MFKAAVLAGLWIMLLSAVAVPSAEAVQPPVYLNLGLAEPACPVGIDYDRNSKVYIAIWDRGSIIELDPDDLFGFTERFVRGRL